MKYSFIKHILLFVVLTSTQLVSAQDLFKVMLSHGVVYYDSAAKVKRPMLNGAKIYAGSRIIVPAGGYVAMIHTNGKTVELNRVGVYKVDSLSQKVAKYASPLSLKFAYSIIALNEQVKKSDYYFNGHYHSEDELRLYAVNKTNIIHDTLLICWQPSEKVESYRVIIYNFFDEEVVSMVTSDSCVRIDMNSSAITYSREKNFIIRIHDEKSGELLTSDGAVLTFILPETEREVNQKMSELRSVNGEYTIPSLLLQAALYEEYKLLFSAADLYQQAIRLHPEIIELRGMYVQFMIRNMMVAGSGDR